MTGATGTRVTSASSQRPLSSAFTLAQGNQGRLARAQEMIELSAGPPPYSLSPMVLPVGC